mgnify:CR=1 FL=1
MKLFRNLFFFSVLAYLASCEPNNPFVTGPIYDAAGNLAIDREKIDSFLDTARIDSLYRIHDPSGVVIIVQEEGVGTRPVINSVVYTEYTGYLMSDYTVFDTTDEDIARENGIFSESRDYVTFRFVLGTGQVIQGWDLGYRRLRPGTKGQMIIPSPYGYRDQAVGERIPENSILIFDFDFLGID